MVQRSVLNTIGLPHVVGRGVSLEAYYRALMNELEERYGHKDTLEKIPLNDYQMDEISYYETWVRDQEQGTRDRP